MPDKLSVVLRSSGFATNEGLPSALHDGSYLIRILSRMQDIMDDLYAGGAYYAPDYITSSGLITLASHNVGPGDIIAGLIHTISCTASGQKVTFSARESYSNFVLITNCKVFFGQGVTLDNVIVATTHTGNSSLTSPSSLQLGRNDNGATDGGTQLLTMGSMKFPADLMVYGSQLIAMGDIAFSANANGIEGASFIAGGTISGTSNMTMGFCGNGMERNFEADYFRLAS